MKELCNNLWTDESGQDLAEYALLLALIGVLLVTTIGSLRSAIANAFSRTISALNTTA